LLQHDVLAGWRIESRDLIVDLLAQDEASGMNHEGEAIRIRKEKQMEGLRANRADSCPDSTEADAGLTSAHESRATHCPLGTPAPR
jgi:hypothetical protein